MRSLKINILNMQINLLKTQSKLRNIKWEMRIKWSSSHQGQPEEKEF